MAYFVLFFFCHSAVILCRQLVFPASDPNSAVLPMEGLEGTTNVPKPRRTALHCLPQNSFERWDPTWCTELTASESGGPVFPSANRWREHLKRGDTGNAQLVSMAWEMSNHLNNHLFKVVLKEAQKPQIVRNILLMWHETIKHALSPSRSSNTSLDSCIAKMST